MYAISLATGDRGGDAAPLYRDPHLIGHIYAGPYLALATGGCRVLVDAEGVAGFAVGVSDSVAFADLLARHWWPTLRARYPMPDPDETTADARRIRMIHDPERTPAEVTGSHPAHLHLNLLPRAQGRGLGHALLGDWIAAQRPGPLHVGVNRENPQAIRFWRRAGFADLTERGRTLWLGRNDAA